MRTRVGSCRVVWGGEIPTGWKRKGNMEDGSVMLQINTDTMA